MKKIFILAVISLLAFSFSFAQGTVRGKISDKNGETLIGVTVVLKSNRSFGVATDFDGNYSIKISDSTAQTLIISYVSYKTTEELVHPVNGEVLIKNIVLESASQDLGIVEVVAKSTRAKEYYMENIKKNSSSTIDYISSETMKKTGDASVSAAVARVSGVSTNGSFITVRGIGDRYVKTTINGSRIPTLDPFTNNIKLDLFPASLVDNIIITKTASPDLPGDWAGAYLSVETKDYPDKLSVNIETAFGYNNQSTFKNVLTTKESPTDWLGYDSERDYNHNDFVRVNMNPTQYQEFEALGLGNYYKTMGITSTTPWNATYTNLGLVQLGLLDKGKFNDPDAISTAEKQYNAGAYKSDAFKIINADAVKSGQAFPNNWNTFYRKAPLNFSQSFSIGNQSHLFGRALGIIAGFRYGSSVVYDPYATANRVAFDPGINNTLISSEMNEQSSKKTNGWSALVNLAYKFNANNSVSLLFMPNFSGVNNVRFTNTKFEINSPTNFQAKEVRNQLYEERKQLVYQLKTEHYIPQKKIKLEINASYTKGKSSIPDFKRFENAIGPAIPAGSVEVIGSKIFSRSYRYLSDNLFDSRLSAEMPIVEKPGFVRKLKIGGAYQDNRRKSDQYDYGILLGPKSKTYFTSFEDAFTPDQFGFHSDVDQFGNFTTIDKFYQDDEQPMNHTFGYSKIKAAFAMLDYSIIPSLRITGGLRVEQAKIFTDAFKFNELGYAADDGRRQIFSTLILHPGTLDEISYLPSANIIYKVKKDESAPINIRVNYSETVARPSIRELTEVSIYDYELRATITGNPDLVMTKIKNYDLRLETYFKNGDNVSLSVFYKDIKDHIELTAGFSDAVNPGFTWENVDKSWVKGIELEGKKKLTKLFELRANLTFVKSYTSFIQKTAINSGGNKYYNYGNLVERTMTGQAPYVINGIFAYTEDSLGLIATLSYNVQGSRLVIGSPNKFDEVYELPRHLLDFKITKTLGKFFVLGITVKDILNSPIRRMYNDDEGTQIDFDKYTYGTSYQLSVSYKI